MDWATPGELQALWLDAGLGQVETSTLVVEADYTDFDDLWGPFPHGIGPTGAYCASLPRERQETLREACFRKLGSPQREFTLSARAWFVRGTAPATTSG